jgi:hypothetical protein
MGWRIAIASLRENIPDKNDSEGKGSGMTRRTEFSLSGLTDHITQWIVADDQAGTFYGMSCT